MELSFNLTDSCLCLKSLLEPENTNIEFSNSTLRVCEIFYEKFKQAEDFLSKLDIKCVSKEKPNSPEDFSYIIKDIQSYINKNLKNNCFTSVKMYDRIININIFYNEEKNLEKIIYQILFWLHVILSFTYHKICSKELNVFLYLTSLKKCLPSVSKVIEKINVNTGFTTSCKIKSNIVIYRKEEWFKVFIHESFHNLGLDFANMNNKLTKESILEFFPIDSDVKLYEAYTDAWAKILNVFTCSYFLSNKTYNDYLSKCVNNLLSERTHCFFQALKILNFMGLDYKNLYEDNKESDELRKQYIEKTSILSYYIINAIILNDFNDFIKWCLKHNINIIQFHQTKEKQKEFCNFIKENHRTDLLLSRIKKINKILLKYQQNKNENQCIQYLSLNMRKSLIEIE